jgi:carbonic anhydrase
MERFEQLLRENKAWAIKKVQEDKDFFNRLVNIQKPDFLWIGCADSRVPPTEITRTQPGEVFIHRNIANMVVHTDLNMLSVLQYAVEVLQVKYVIVCGHYGCGGVKAAMSNQSIGIIDTWLRNIKDVYRFNQAEVDALPTESERVNRLIELNVKEQVHNLAKTAIIQRSWKKHQIPTIHGWVYDLADGIINPLLTIKPNDKLDHPIYEYHNLG